MPGPCRVRGGGNKKAPPVRAGRCGAASGGVGLTDVTVGAQELATIALDDPGVDRLIAIGLRLQGEAHGFGIPAAHGSDLCECRLLGWERLIVHHVGSLSCHRV